MNILKLKEKYINKNTIKLFDMDIHFENSNFDSELYLGIRA